MERRYEEGRNARSVDSRHISTRKETRETSIFFAYGIFLSGMLVSTSPFHRFHFIEKQDESTMFEINPTTFD